MIRGPGKYGHGCLHTKPTNYVHTSPFVLFRYCYVPVGLPIFFKDSSHALGKQMALVTVTVKHIRRIGPQMTDNITTKNKTQKNVYLMKCILSYCQKQRNAWHTDCHWLDYYNGAMPSYSSHHISLSTCGFHLCIPIFTRAATTWKQW